MAKRVYSTSEVAGMLGISRIAVFKKIRSGTLPAKKVGRNFVIERKELNRLLGTALDEKRRQEIEAAVRKTVQEYGETLELLGKE